jgi:two-component system phosphate regulon sensor histidine kinase PhoR
LTEKKKEVPPFPGGEERDVFIPGRNFEEMLARLGSNESMLDVILNSMGEGVLLLNQADRIVLMNPSAQKILGIGEKESLGKLYLEVVRNPVLADLLTRSKKEGGLASGEIELGGKEEKTFAVSVAAIRAEREQHLGQIVVFSDITSLKRLMRMRTDFVANVSHELKTPLTAIMGYVETLIEGAVDDKKNRSQFLQKISDQAHRLHALISDVLELSKIESGGYISSLEPVEVGEVVQQALDLLKTKWEAKEIKVLTDIPAGTRVIAHREGLFHVVENLLDNAVKYSPEKSRVRIAVAPREGGLVELTVQDEGPGIPPEAQNRVFERFFRVDVSRSREQGGTGLGLAIVKHLVEKMKGEVSLESREGQGSVFKVILTKA